VTWWWRETVGGPDLGWDSGEQRVVGAFGPSPEVGAWGSRRGEPKEIRADLDGCLSAARPIAIGQPLPLLSLG